MLKICIIGGGSSYTPEIIEGFILRSNELPVSEIFLLDIEEGRHKLDIITDLTRRMIEKSGLSIKVHSSTNRKEALANADFVVTQIRVGGINARINDEENSIIYGNDRARDKWSWWFCKSFKNNSRNFRYCRGYEKTLSKCMVG